MTIPKKAFVKCLACRWQTVMLITLEQEEFFRSALNLHNAGEMCSFPDLVVLPTATRRPPPGFRLGTWTVDVGSINGSLKVPLESGLKQPYILTASPKLGFYARFTGFDANSSAG